MGLHEIKKLLHSKGKGHQTKEAVHRMGINFANYTSNKELITELRGVQKLNSPKNQ
jgi:hypothetical protein